MTPMNGDASVYGSICAGVCGAICGVGCPIGNVGCGLLCFVDGPAPFADAGGVGAIAGAGAVVGGGAGGLSAAFASGF